MYMFLYVMCLSLYNDYAMVLLIFLKCFPKSSCDMFMFCCYLLISVSFMFANSNISIFMHNLNLAFLFSTTSYL